MSTTKKRRPLQTPLAPSEYSTRLCQRYGLLFFVAEQFFSGNAKHSRQLLQGNRSWFVSCSLNIRDGLGLHAHELSKLALCHLPGYAYFLNIILHGYFSLSRLWSLTSIYEILQKINNDYKKLAIALRVW